MSTLIGSVTAWRRRRLVFRKDTLAYIAAEFNRYNRTPKIRVEGETLRLRRFNGVFDADNPLPLLQFLKKIMT
jgi:transmembrane sensor